jgi:molecular chaperone DnaK (HSP70)
MILERLKRVAERGDGGAVSVWKSRLGFRFRTVTVSVPVNFSKEQKAATLRAARSAGFTVARLLEEPVAAAVAHGLLEKNEKDARKEKRDENDGGKLVLVYDMGGGTLDVAVLRSEKSSGTFLVMGSAGDERLGGEDFDRALLDRWLLKRLETDPTTRSEPIFFPNDAGLRERALREMERAKRFLVDQSSAVRVSVTFMREPLGNNAVGATTKQRLVVADVKTLLSEDEESDAEADSDESDEQKSLAKKKTTLTLSLADFESACSALLDKATAPVYAALRNAGGVGVKEITDVVMVGGSSRLKSVQTRLAAVFGEDRVKRGGENGPDPETAVAVGAARSYAC